MTYWVIIQFDRIAWRDALPSCVIRIQAAYLEVNLEGFLHSRPQCLRVWGRDWFSWCNFFFLCGLQINNESGLNAEARSKQKTMGLFRLWFSFRAAVTLTLWTREVGQLLCGYFSPMEKEKKKHQKPPATQAFALPVLTWVACGWYS